jgi:abortive infection bacteriophage resistance protein
MGESQHVIEYNVDLLTALETSLSTPRIQPYIAKANGNIAHAWQLYLWNARLAKSFLFPLGVLEVTVRNRIHHSLSSAFGTPDWIQDPKAHYAYFNDYTCLSHITAKDRLTNLKGAPPKSDELVAALSFDFWSNLLRSEYKSLWDEGNRLKDAFPLMNPMGLGTIRPKVSRVNLLRNRIAHHEPIHTMHLRDELNNISEVATIYLQKRLTRCSIIV